MGSILITKSRRVPVVNWARVTTVGTRFELLIDYGVWRVPSAPSPPSFQNLPNKIGDTVICTLNSRVAGLILEQFDQEPPRLSSVGGSWYFHRTTTLCEPARP
jgi:hypothetical protein